MELSPQSGVPPKLDKTSPGSGPHAGSGAPFELVRDEARRSPSYLLHPLSGVLIILVDSVFFGVDAITLGLSLPVSCIMAFMTVTTGIFLTQRFLSGDRTGPAAAKAFLGGVLAGVPTPITGTVFGTLVLVSAGLSSVWRSPSSPK